ncbi:TNF receptor-associated factor 3-like, partial [Mercenaria mercenaria]|uniref:TNF receptor-associated factor 3-like n=1 Tax=Mercenaria mercenaria TaxID=6596 RepID=UPI00234EDB8F
ITADPSGRREIRNRDLYCEFKDFGCKQVTKWKDLADHLRGCKFQPTECSNKKFGCKVALPGHLLEQHIQNDCEYRQVQCQYCKNLIPVKLLQTHVEEECLVVQLACPYNCGSQPMARAELNNHKAMCPSKPKECKFQSVGCAFKVSTKFLHVMKYVVGIIIFE